MMNNTGFKILRAFRYSRKRWFSEHFKIVPILAGNTLGNRHSPYSAKYSECVFDSPKLYWNDLELATSCNLNSTPKIQTDRYTILHTTAGEGSGKSCLREVDQ